MELLDRIIYIERAIKELIKQKEVQIIIIEELAMTRNAKVVKALGGLLVHLLVEFRKQELLTVVVRPTQWRAGKIKGVGREMLKNVAITYVMSNYNKVVKDDEAEAIIIAEYGNSLEIKEE
jgi:Holliday junction resolvasome RuvABC endonuclease subunit